MPSKWYFYPILVITYAQCFVQRSVSGIHISCSIYQTWPWLWAVFREMLCHVVLDITTDLLNHILCISHSGIGRLWKLASIITSEFTRQQPLSVPQASSDDLGTWLPIWDKIRTSWQHQEWHCAWFDSANIFFLTRVPGYSGTLIYLQKTAAYPATHL